MRGKALILTICCLLFSVALWGCGGNGAPAGSVITINPTSNTITDAGTDVTTHTFNYTISLVDSTGKPLGFTHVEISCPLANPDVFNVIQLFDSDTPRKSPFEAVTNDIGVYYLRVDVQTGGGLKYTTNVEARSGASFVSSTLTVQ